jgi:hypothetical protein
MGVPRPIIKNIFGTILNLEGAHMGLSIPGGWVNEGVEAEMKIRVIDKLTPK